MLRNKFNKKKKKYKSYTERNKGLERGKAFHAHGLEDLTLL